MARLRTAKRWLFNWTIEQDNICWWKLISMFPKWFKISEMMSNVSNWTDTSSYFRIKTDILEKKFFFQVLLLFE
jgi:hypothetical protein